MKTHWMKNTLDEKHIGCKTHSMRNTLDAKHIG